MTTQRKEGKNQRDFPILVVVTGLLADRGGSRGRVQGVRTPPPSPRDDLRFSNTTGTVCGPWSAEVPDALGPRLFRK